MALSELPIHRRLVLPCSVTMVVLAPSMRYLGVSTPCPSCLIRRVGFTRLVRNLRGLLFTCVSSELPRPLVRWPMGNRRIVILFGPGAILSCAMSVLWLLRLMYLVWTLASMRSSWLLLR